MLGKALVCHEYGSSFTWSQVELTPLQENEVLVQLVATGICHTDISMSKGALPIPPPMVLGHEGKRSFIISFAAYF
jgi:Zn-dependent alcohol dehydrogenase